MVEVRDGKKEIVEIRSNVFVDAAIFCQLFRISYANN